MGGDATFSRLEAKETPLYGAAKFLLCGFTEDGARRFHAAAAAAGLAQIPRVWVEAERAGELVGALFALPDGTGAGRSSELPCAVIVAGIPQAGLIRLMALWRKGGGGEILWAVLTPVSETWTLRRLLAELERERRALRSRRGSRRPPR
ncbi:MAG: DUF3783 domain-containing protein [Desulfobacterales bacterium]